MHRLFPLLTSVILLTGCGTPERTAEDEPSRAGTDPVETRPEATRPDTPRQSIDSATATPTGPRPTLPTTLLEPAVGGFELIQPGTEPRSPLRFKPSVGAHERVELTMTMTMSVSGPGLPPTVQKLPPIKQINRAETLAVADGRITEKIVFESISVDGAAGDPKLAQAMQAAMQEIRGFEQTMVYDERGGVIEGDMKLPEDASAQLAQTFETLGKTFEQAMVRLPEPPIGVGGKWKETNAINNGGLELEQTTEFALVERDGERITITTQVTQKPLTNKYAPDNSPVEFELTEFDSKGAGRLVYELSTLMPESVTTILDTKFTAETSNGEQTQQLTLEMHIELEMARIDE